MAPAVTLTFDNGPTPGVTERVLDVLDAHGVTATFFVVGAKLATPAGRGLAAETIARGHALGGHTWTHSVPFGLADDDTVTHELAATRAAVDDVGGDGALFRPYGVGGAVDERLMSDHGARLLRAGGYTCALWTSVPRDWVDPDGWPDVALAAIAADARSVVVLHDVAGAALARLDGFLGRAADAGVSYTLDLPDECTPVRAGRPTASYHLLGVA